MRRPLSVGVLALLCVPLTVRGQGTAPARVGDAAPGAQPQPQPVQRPALPSPTIPGTAAPRAAAPRPAAPAPAPNTPPPPIPEAEAEAPAVAPGGAPAAEAFQNAMAAPAGGPATNNGAGAFGTMAGFSAGGVPQMIGDLGPLPRVSAAQAGLPSPFPPPTPPGVPRPSARTLVAPTVRTIKVSEDQSPFPQDRVYYNFNYFDNVNGAVNARLNAPIAGVQVFREIFGIEKTFNDGQGSIGLRFPLNTVSAASRAPGAFGTFGGSSTAVGDLSIIGKYILLGSAQTGRILSGGLDLTVPTGPGRFAGFSTFGGGPHSMTFQPFLGGWASRGNFFVQGFSVIDVPTTSQDVTMFYKDIGVGYFFRRDTPDSGFDRLVTLIAPMFEVHVNVPLNHTDAFSRYDPAGTPTMVNLTYGLNIGLRYNTLFTMALVTPVAEPKPFTLEAMAFVNVFFGRTARRLPISPPLAGGS